MRCARSGSIRGCGRRTSASSSTSRSRTLGACPARVCLRGRLVALDELDLVAVRVLDESDDARPALDRAGVARHLAAAPLHLCACLGGVRHGDGDVAVGRAEVVLVDAVVVSELEDRGPVFGVVADERERVLLLGMVGGPEELYPEHFGVELY